MHILDETISEILKIHAVIKNRHYKDLLFPPSKSTWSNALNSNVLNSSSNPFNVLLGVPTIIKQLHICGLKNFNYSWWKILTMFLF